MSLMSPARLSSRACPVLVKKQSRALARHYADNPKTSMYFADAKTAVADLTSAVKTHVG
jgi:hypothetical protein